MSVFPDWHFLCRFLVIPRYLHDAIPSESPPCHPERTSTMLSRASLLHVIPSEPPRCHPERAKRVEGSIKPKIINKPKNMIKPLADRVVIEPKAAETQTASGLYIPDTAKEKPQQGTVVAAGPGKKDEPMEVKVGDVVIYGKYAGTEVSVDGKDYLIMKQSDILAIL